jgi:hypothetical protein
VGVKTPEKHSHGLGQTLILIVMVGTSEVALCYKASSIGIHPQPLKPNLYFMTHSAWPATPFQRRTICGEQVSLNPQVELSKTEGIIIQIVRPEDFASIRR